MDNRQIAELISERIGPRPVPFEAVRTLALEIYHDLGGREDDENFADIFEILLSILPLTNLIDDTSIYLDKTWSSYKIDESFNQVITGVEDLMIFDCSTIEPTTTNFVPGTEYTVHEALQRTANLFGGYQDEIDDINALIPGQATESNQLADKSFVNSTVATNAANFRGNWTNWAAVPTDATLYPEDYVGNKTPNNNDYMVVQDASDYVSPESLVHKLTVVNLHATKKYTIGITDEYGVYNEYYYNDGFSNTWKFISTEYSLKYKSGVPGKWYIKTNKPEHTHIIKNGVSYSNANDGILLVKTDDSTVPVIIGIQPQVGDYQGSWRFIYVGDWNTSGKSGWNPQYKVGSTFTAAQQAAIDSGITAIDVSTYNSYSTSITALQTDKLDKVYTGLKIYGTNTLGEQISYVAGTGISFANGKISNTNTEASWGNITGTLSNQTDLSTALDSKQDVLTAGNNITINGTTISANDTTYSASDNIDITNNAIKAVGYRYDTTNGAFAEGDRDIVKDGTTYLKSTATGIMSHAEGTDTSASGTASHAEGYLTIALGEQSHAEGLNTIASGNGTHAEGISSWALADGSHTEGGETTATGNYSHAEGYRTYASGTASHAEGKGKFATLGSVITISTEGSNNLYELSSLTTTVSDKTYTLQVGNTVNCGTNYAKVTAIDTSTKTITTDKNLGAKAGYTISLVIGGSYGDSAHSEGYLATAFGDYSHAEGYLTTASSNYSHAEGYNTIASGAASHAGGYVFSGSISAKGNGSFAHGYTIGGYIDASGAGAVAIGYADRNTIRATGKGALAEGVNTGALAEGAHAEGKGTTAEGRYSHAEGLSTKALTNATHAEGRNTTAEKDYSHAEGRNTTASGNTSHAEGYLTTASGNYSHVEGYYTEAKNLNEHASGMYNKSNNLDANAQTIFSIGIGTSATDRKNAIEVLRNGSVYIKGIGGYDGTNPFNSSSLQDFLSSLSGGGNA